MASGTLRPAVAQLSAFWYGELAGVLRARASDARGLDLVANEIVKRRFGTEPGSRR